MASTITNYSLIINPQFPVPGQDNDTQGFRDNFGYIQNALGSAAAEISDLQIENIGIANRLDNITSPTYINAVALTATNITSDTINNNGTIYSDFFNGDGRYLTNISVSSITNISNLTSLEVTNLTVSLINNYTPTKFVSSAPAASTGTVGDLKGMVFADGSYMYICYSNYVNTTTNIWAKISTVGGTW